MGKGSHQNIKEKSLRKVYQWEKVLNINESIYSKYKEKSISELFTLRN